MSSPSSKLGTYNRKRNFSLTPEPPGVAEESSEQLRFAIQHHRARADHYDLRLEWDGALLSWAVPKGPSYNPRDKRLAVQVEDHPLPYRHFEGTIPQGEYGGGTVMLWDEGFWEPWGDVKADLRQGELKFFLSGRRLKGAWVLVRLKAKSDESNHNWLLIKERDDFARTESGFSGNEESIRTGRSMDEIARDSSERLTRNPFHHAAVQLAKLVSKAPGGDEWLYEVKYDGYRALAYLEENHTLLVSRNGKDYTDRFLPLAASLADWANGRAMVLDGELVIADTQGKTSFQSLQSYLRAPQGLRPTYMAFDLLALDGADLRGRPLRERKQLLATLLQPAPGNVHYSNHVTGQGEDSLRAACELHLEGIVGKRAESVYSGTRNGDWVKLKCFQRQEFVIGGYTRSEKKADGISSLLLGVYHDDRLVYAGRAGSGLGERTAKDLCVAFSELERDASPFVESPKPRAREHRAWLEPRLVAEIQFTEWTEDHLLRHPSFKGLRADKDPRDVHRENADDQPIAPDQRRGTMKNDSTGVVIEGIGVTNPRKKMFGPHGASKEDVVRYYARVSSRMLPYIKRRILSIVRCPAGAGSSCFYRKHPGSNGKDVISVHVPGNDGEPEEYFYIDRAAGLISEAQMDTLEFHVWGSRIDSLEKPDLMVFDLDPDEGLGLDAVRQGVRDLKEVLDELALTTFLKTSGGKGYHVVIPFEPTASWDAFHDFARRVAQAMEQRWPDRYTSNVRKAQRKGKIFIDWIRNGRGATSVAPYSLRARDGAPVAMPITWGELDEVAPGDIDMAEALTRIAADDPWDGFFDISQSLATKEKE